MVQLMMSPIVLFLENDKDLCLETVCKSPFLSILCIIFLFCAIGAGGKA